MTEREATALMEILLTRGYFHDNNRDDEKDDGSNQNPSVSPSSPPTSWKDPIPTYAQQESWVVTTKNGSYATISYLQSKVEEIVNTKGSCFLTDLADALDLGAQVLTKCVLPKNDFVTTKCCPTNGGWIQLSDRILTTQYLDDTANHVAEQLIMLETTDGGCLTVSFLAHKYQWTTEDCRRFLSHRLQEKGIEERRNDKGMFVYSTKAFQEKLENVVIETLSQSQTIVNLHNLCQDKKWEFGWINNIVHQKIDQLPGIIRGDDFVPNAHRQNQEQTVLDHFTTNGFVTTALSSSVDLLPNQIKALLRSKFPDCIVMQDSVIDYATVGVPLESLVQEAAESFAELRPPLDLLNFPLDIHCFVQEYVFPNCNETVGTLTVTPERILFVSKVMMDDIVGNILPPIMEPIIRERAAMLDKKQQMGIELDAMDDLISSEIVVEALMDAFPGLQVLPHDGDDEILQQFVATSILHDEFRETCTQAVIAEMQRIHAARAKQRGLITHTSTAEVAFEDPSCFAAACHVIQMQYKFLEYAEKIGMAQSDRSILEKEILEGCCRDFVRRLTLFLLDKYEVENSPISFEVEGGGDLALLSFCTPVDITLRRYPKFVVKCELDSKGGERSLAEALTESVPLQAGKSLAELGEASSVKQFLQLAEENCLSICGVPFRKTDKKSEKLFLANRRQRLSELLQRSQDPIDVLEYTIMLTYQSIKNQAVFGSLLTGPILQQLTKERKIPVPVGEALCSLAKSLDSCTTDLVEKVRCCGLAKDIAKHVVE